MLSSFLNKVIKYTHPPDNDMCIKCKVCSWRRHLVTPTKLPKKKKKGKRQTTQRTFKHRIYALNLPVMRLSRCSVSAKTYTR